MKFEYRFTDVDGREQVVSIRRQSREVADMALHNAYADRINWQAGVTVRILGAMQLLPCLAYLVNEGFTLLSVIPYGEGQYAEVWFRPGPKKRAKVQGCYSRCPTDWVQVVQMQNMLRAGILRNGASKEDLG